MCMHVFRLHTYMNLRCHYRKVNRVCVGEVCTGGMVGSSKEKSLSRF